MNQVVADGQIVKCTGLGIELQSAARTGVGNLVPAEIDAVRTGLELHRLVELDTGAGGGARVVHPVAVHGNVLGCRKADASSRSRAIGTGNVIAQNAPVGRAGNSQCAESAAEVHAGNHPVVGGSRGADSVLLSGG